jgi:kynurenine formamidase
MDFIGPQPNHFGAPRASQQTLQLGEFTGVTRRGGSCNVDQLQLIPHCNGTHTESVGHIVNQDVFVGHHVIDAFTSATLVTVRPQLWRNVTSRTESYRPALQDTDWVITREELRSAVEATGISGTSSLIVRTATQFEKKSVAYGDQNPPAFFTVQAMQYLVAGNFRHLLVDMPSVDRMYDDGLLTNHHLFWNVPEGTHELTEDSRQDKTITEMVLVPEAVEDGLYLLNLQMPTMCTDAVPSCPVIYRVNTG